jgi:flagellar basal body rod protein FlgF
MVRVQQRQKLKTPAEKQIFRQNVLDFISDKPLKTTEIFNMLKGVSSYSSVIADLTVMVEQGFLSSKLADGKKYYTKLKDIYVLPEKRKPVANRSQTDFVKSKYGVIVKERHIRVPPSKTKSVAIGSSFYMI